VSAKSPKEKFKCVLFGVRIATKIFMEAKMTEPDSAVLRDLLIQANRVLIMLESLSPGEGHQALIVLEAREVYSQMLSLLGKKSMTAVEALNLQHVMDRMQANLRFFRDRL
jgi:hypothetical protein